MNHSTKKYRLMVASLALGSGLAGAANYRLMLNEENRLSAPIASHSLNRIVVVGDRIQNIFGEEGTFSVQSDEQSGQVFIKPSLENAHQPLVLTLITENGLTQDLDLVPSATEASTIILKPKPNTNATPEDLRVSDANTGMQPWIETLRQAVLGRLIVQDKAKPSVRKHPQVELRYQRTYLSHDVKVEVWRLKNKTRDVQELFEKDFYVTGDVALSLEDKSLAPGAYTTLYIVGGPHV